MKQDKKPKRVVKAWNDAHDIGTTVEYRELAGGQPLRTQTRSSAFVLGGHTAVVMLASVRGAVALEHCTPIAEEAAATA